MAQIQIVSVMLYFSHLVLKTFVVVVAQNKDPPVFS